MQVTDLHTALVQMTAEIEARGLHGYAQCQLNWFGTEIQIDVTAREDVDPNGYWQSEKSFKSRIDDADEALTDARAWIAGLPDQEARAIELMVRKLNELADKLPKGGNDIARTAWEEIGRMLLARADRISKNGLSSPERISQLPRSA